MRIGIFIEKRTPKQTLENVKNQTEPGVEASPADEILLEELRRRYDLLRDIEERLNTKAGLVMAYLGGIGIAVLNMRSDIIKWFVEPVSFEVILAISLWGLFFVLYFLATASCVVTIFPRRVYTPLGIEPDEVEFYLSLQRTDLLMQIISQYSHFTLRNAPVFARKNRWVLCSMISATLLTILLMAVSFLT